MVLKSSELEKKTHFPHDKMLIFRQKTADFLDLTLFQDFIFLNIMIGLFLVSFADDYFATLQPMYLLDLNISKVK